MRKPSADRGAAEMRNMRRLLEEADDAKFPQIMKLVEASVDPQVNALILAPLRSRLAVLKPPRPLRFTRLLFLPVQPVIVMQSEWLSTAPVVPRTALQCIGHLVRRAMGAEADRIDRMIAPYSFDDEQVVEQAGALLWAPAGRILERAGMPGDWTTTGLPVRVFQPMAGAIGALLSRAMDLRQIAQDRTLGALVADDRLMHDIMRSVADKSMLGAAMIARLIVSQAPLAVPLLRPIVGSRRKQAERELLDAAIEQGIDVFLTSLESDAGLAEAVGVVPMAVLGDRLHGIAALVREAARGATGLVDDRVQSIRDILSRTCQARFKTSLVDDLLTPLADATGPVDAPRQTALEVCARNLRKLETAARTLGGADAYDRMLDSAVDQVNAAAQAGRLSFVRKCRLIELLAGPEAAAALCSAKPRRP